MTQSRNSVGQRAEQAFSEANLYPREPLVPAAQVMEKKSESQFPTELMGWKNICSLWAVCI